MTAEEWNWEEKIKSLDWTKPPQRRGVNVYKKRAKKVKKPKPETTTSVDLDCLALWGQIVIKRDKVCRITGSSSNLSPHHIRSRGHAYTRYDLSNGMCLSWSIHRLQKLNPERFMDLIIECIGDAEYQRLKALSSVAIHRKIQNFRDERARLQSILLSQSNQMDSDVSPFSADDEAILKECF